MRPLPCYLPRRLAGITLIEMLVVMAVIGIITGVSLAGITFSTPRRQVAVSTLKGVLDQTRAYAVEKRKYTAFMVVDGLTDDSMESPNLRKYAVFEVGELSTTGEYVVIQPARQVTEWKTLPTGVVFLKNDPNYPSALDSSVTSNIESVKIRTIRSGTNAGSPMGAYPTVDVRFSSQSTPVQLPGIVFAPTGAVASPRLANAGTLLNVCIVEGTSATTGGTSRSVRNQPDSITEGVRLARLTGVTRYLDPDRSASQQDDSKVTNSKP